MRPPMPTDRRTELLASVPLFQSCSARQLAEAAELVVELDVSPGHVLFSSDDDAASCYIVVAGEAHVCVDGEVVANLGPGSYCGEWGTSEPHMPGDATVTAFSAMCLLAVRPSDLAELLDLATAADRSGLQA